MIRIEKFAVKKNKNKKNIGMDSNGSCSGIISVMVFINGPKILFSYPYYIYTTCIELYGSYR
ncbi:hypothetical protein HanIR_Chr15g0769931 [Helianthus annuus]|nr:hypothetical protein HanIR_Chr15g0769931 [Helianthus annuus]